MFAIQHQVKITRSIVALLVLATINLLVFWQMFGFHQNNDTASYVMSINYFRGEERTIFSPNRFLNPFYSFLAATIFQPLTPQQSIIVTNIIFYFGFILLTYGLIRRVFNERVGFLTALALMTAYPMIRYALTQVEDVGGYFWFVLTLYAGWRWFEDKQSAWLFLGGVAISGGMLTKESGAMGALFFAALIFLSTLNWKEKITKLGMLSSLAFVTLVVNQLRGRVVEYSSLKWFVYNWHQFAPTNYKFFKWVGVMASTYNVLWIAFFIGVYLLIRKRVWNQSIKIYLLAVVVPSLSYLAWPLFISRTVFISAWLIIPIAALAVNYLAERYSPWVYVSWAIIMVAPYILQETLRYAHVFQIIETCHYQVKCSWNYFWDNRHTFSTIE